MEEQKDRKPFEYEPGERERILRIADLTIQETEKAAHIGQAAALIIRGLIDYIDKQDKEIAELKRQVEGG